MKPQVKVGIMEKWDWYSLENLPQPLFAALNDSFEALKSRKKFFDEKSKNISN